MILIAMCGLLTASCVTTTPPISRLAAANPVSGYVYGKFVLRPAVDKAGWPKLKMALVIEREDAKGAATMEFSLRDRTLAYSLAPGRYRISELIYADDEYKKMGSDPLPPHAVTGSIVIEAGKAYYLGDYLAATQFTPGFQVATYRWHLAALNDQFAETTHQLRAEYPGLSPLQPVNALNPAASAADRGR